MKVSLLFMMGIMTSKGILAMQIINEDDKDFKDINHLINMMLFQEYDKVGDKVGDKKRKKLQLTNSDFIPQQTLQNIFDREKKLSDQCQNFEKSAKLTDNEILDARLAHLEEWKDFIRKISINPFSPKALIRTYINASFQIAYLTNATTQNLEQKKDLWESYVILHNKHISILGDRSSSLDTAEKKLCNLQKITFNKKRKPGGNLQTQQTRFQLLEKKNESQQTVFDKEKSLVQQCTDFEKQNKQLDENVLKTNRLTYLERWVNLRNEIKIDENSKEEIIKIYINCSFQIAYLTSSTSQDITLKTKLWSDYKSLHTKYDANKFFPSYLTAAEKCLQRILDAKRVILEKSQKKPFSGGHLSQPQDQSEE